MTGIRKRLRKLEAKGQMQPPLPRFDSSPAAIEQAALAKLSAVDRALFQENNAGLEDTEAYKELIIRWEGAREIASWEAGVIYLDPEERGWL